MKWLARIAEIGLAVLVYRLIPALIIAWQTAGAAAVTAASIYGSSGGCGQPVGIERHRHGGQAARGVRGTRRGYCRLGDWHVVVREVRDRPQGWYFHGRGADEGHRAPALPVGGFHCHLQFRQHR